MTEPPYSLEEGQILLHNARESIRNGLESHRLLIPELDHIPPTLLEPRACFVTLEKNHTLRGCIGGLEPRHPLLHAVARSAYQSAFADPRFPPLAADEEPHINISISILSPPEPLPAKSNLHLIQSLRPRIDGLILEDREKTATFLPSVWEQLPDPAEFLAHLKRKAGWPESYWSPTLTASRYTAATVSEPRFSLH
ncbi:MAG TPA: AmmeMemoRadiSam system protein A [Kiritimatiellia bacterium]|nr:AmmeMemoRadiSam system protein A [Kiritimatiellia bacterium]